MTRGDPNNTPDAGGAPVLEGQVDFAGYGYQVVTLVGVYQVLRRPRKMGGRGGTKTAHLVMAPNCRVSLSGQADADMAAYDGATVVVTGQVMVEARAPDPAVAAPRSLPHLIQITSLRRLATD